MKNWVLTGGLDARLGARLGALLGLAVGAAAGCQAVDAPGPATTEAAPATAEAAQAATQDCVGGANFCGAPKVTISSWTTSDPFPQSAPNTVVVVVRTGSLFQAYGADPVAGRVQWGVEMKTAVLGVFLGLADGKALKYGGVRPPPTGTCPPECGQPLVGYLLEAALRIAPISDQALAAENACHL